VAYKIYTKTGDAGETSLFGGKRLPKHHLRIETYGTVDELNAFLGLLRDGLSREEGREWLQIIQNRLFTVGANLASDPEKPLATPDLFESDIELLEKAIDQMESELPPLKNFILPGGHPLVSQAHVARTVCRRAERLASALGSEESVDPLILRYLNRLSDFLFVFSRKIGQDLGVAEVIWTATR
jgi:cob(I)alamin adenosyltransferase